MNRRTNIKKFPYMKTRKETEHDDTAHGDKNEGQSRYPLYLSPSEEAIYELISTLPQPFRPAFVYGKVKGMKKGTIKRLVMRMGEKGLLRKDIRGRGWYRIAEWAQEGRSVEILGKLFLRGEPLLIHDLILTGTIPEAFTNVVYKRGWGAPKVDLNSESISKVDFVPFLSPSVGEEEAFKLTVKVWKNDRVQVSTSNTKAPMDLLRFLQFLAYLGGVFEEAFGEGIGSLFVRRFHIHNDRYDLADLGIPFVEVRVFKQVWLKVYTKEDLPGKPLRMEADLRGLKLGVQNVVELLSQERDMLQAMNFIAETREKLDRLEATVQRWFQSTVSMFQDIKKTLRAQEDVLWEEKVTVIVRAELEEAIKPILPPRKLDVESVAPLEYPELVSLKESVARLSKSFEVP